MSRLFFQKLNFQVIEIKQENESTINTGGDGKATSIVTYKGEVSHMTLLPLFFPLVSTVVVSSSCLWQLQAAAAFLY